MQETSDFTANDDDVFASQSDTHDDFETITGIDPATANALYFVGLRRYADLAQYTPESLSAVLHEEAELSIPAERIAIEDWLGQAHEQSRYPAVMSTASSDEHSVDRDGESDPAAARTAERGSEAAKTPSLREPPEATKERAETPAPPKTAIRRAPTPEPPRRVDLEILGFHVHEPAVPVGGSTLEKSLMAELRFRLSGPRADPLTRQHLRFQVSIYTVDLTNKALTLVATEEGTFGAQQLEHTSRRRFRTPTPGRHEVHAVVLLLPPCARMKSCQGPILRVVP